MSAGAQPVSGIAKYRVLRELGARVQPSFAAIREPHELVVIHRFVKRGSPFIDGAVQLSADDLGLLLRDAHCLAKNWHPNVARIKHVDVAHGHLTIASELLEGSTLSDLVALSKPGERSLPIDVLVRILLDVLAGLHGIHALRDGRSIPIGAIHGELCPANIVVGRDGVTRIVNALRVRPARVAANSEALGYSAPEVLDGGAADGRADVHSVGVILWEALSGKRLHDENDPARVLSRQRAIDIPRPRLPSDSPYAALADVAMRALAFDPALRFPAAAAMAAELRKLQPSHIATGSTVASWVLALDGERIRGRRMALDPACSGSRRAALIVAKKPLSVVRTDTREHVAARPSVAPVDAGASGDDAGRPETLVTPPVVVPTVLESDGVLIHSEPPRSPSGEVAVRGERTTEPSLVLVRAGVSGADALESGDDGVDGMPAFRNKRRHRVLAIVAVLFLAGSIVHAFRSVNDRTASRDPRPAVRTAAGSETPAIEPAVSASAATTTDSRPSAANASEVRRDEGFIAPPLPLADEIPAPLSQPSASEGAPKTAPRPQQNRRYEPLGI